MTSEFGATRFGIEGLKGLFAWARVMLRPEAPQVFILCVLVLLNALLAGIADPLAIKYLLDNLTRHDWWRFVSVALALVGFVTTLRQLGSYIERLTQAIVSSVTERLVSGSLQGFYRIPYEDVAGRDAGYFVARIADESMQVAGVVPLTVQLLQACALCVAAVIVCLWLSWTTSLILCGIVPILRIAALRYRKRIAKAVVDASEYDAKLKEVLGRSVDGYRTVNIFALLEVVEVQVRRELHRFLMATNEQVRYSSAFKALSGTLLSYSELSVFVAAGAAVLRGVLSIGGLFAFVSAYGRLTSSVESVISTFPTFAAMDVRRQRVTSLMASPHRTPKPDFTQDVVGDSIAVRRGPNVVLSDLDISIRAGERLLIHGPNGSGKSTLAYTLCGFLTIHAGTLRVPGLPRISALLTPHHFVPGSLSDNLRGSYNESLNYDQFTKLKKELNFDVELAQDPSQLSEGQKRKCQILITLMKDADLYIFDEPLANIDGDSMPSVMNAIFSHTQGKALIVIMHGITNFRSAFHSELELTSLNPKLKRRADAEAQIEEVLYEV